MTHSEDIADVDAVLAGDAERFRGIVQRWKGPLTNLAWKYVRQEAVAEEMAQEAFLLAFRKLGQWRREAEFSTWLFALAANSYRSSLRKRELPTEGQPALDALATTRPSGESDPEQRTLEASRNRAIRAAVHSLPGIYREALTLFYFHDTDLLTTAEILGLPPGTLKARLHRGRKLLKKELAQL